MNNSQSTYSNNSRFVSSHRDPLQKYKESLKEKFKLMYDQIEEQKFTNPFVLHEGTIFLTEQQSLRSFLNSTQKLVELSQFQDEQISVKRDNQIIPLNAEPCNSTIKKIRPRIFDPPHFPQPLILSLVKTSYIQNTLEQLHENKNGQTNFKEDKLNLYTPIQPIPIQKPKSSIGTQVNQTIEHQEQQNVSVQYSINIDQYQSQNHSFQSYIDRYYDYQQQEQCIDRKQNKSESKFQNENDDYFYMFCLECQQFVRMYKNNHNQFHQRHCKTLKYENTFSEFIGKFKYLLVYETNQMRDYDERCIKIRKYCHVASEICTVLQKTFCNKRINQLKVDLIKIHNEVYKLHDTHSMKIYQLFQQMKIQLAV
ncbi:unnamed protein product (macronuclear) [Paramecium tetraurelia]|uniref:Uncharacterized protein n=1 Tax=Paramecium tetraurelia TaxID=5888 RepID=A0CUH0_PARTE|nr:uncharacterized protein GSPATT00010637001 [Paramecium tetraurelia]CAK74437.1 unnamed protein product [Paramecium tetraurelia]|eukprot:XP_001441834.1 hypothetical protein (macronuclear) [Paramecium tetraurelia strain d4-2]